jgi:hypothetical protein
MWGPARLPPREIASATFYFGGLLWEGIRRDKIPVVAMDEQVAMWRRQSGVYSSVTLTWFVCGDQLRIAAGADSHGADPPRDGVVRSRQEA